MLKYFFIALFITHSFAAKLSLDQRRSKILEIINEELGEIQRLARQQNKSNAETMIRLSELYLEKARLYREAENEKFLSIDPEKRGKIDKKEFFSQSRSLFMEANKAAHDVIKTFPKYKNIGEIYYILAFNYKELNDHANAEKYFELATKKTNPQTKIGGKSQLALADYYFNANKFSQAIPLYQAALKTVNEAWWTKDAFNLAWSYYRTKKYDQAIELMKDVHRKSGQEKYINMRPMVERDIALFYVDAKDLAGAEKFYASLGKDFSEQFTNVAISLTAQGRLDQAEILLQKAESYTKDESKKMNLWMAQLNLYEKLGRIDLHYNKAKLFVDRWGKVNSDDKKLLQFQISKKAAELQKAAASELYQHVPQKRMEKAKYSISYFELMARIQDKKAETYFFQAESYFVAELYEDSINAYLRAHKQAKEENNKKIIQQSLEGMLSALGQKKLGSKVAEKYYVEVYTKYLDFDRKSDRSKSIHTKLFNKYHGDGKLKEAEGVLNSFVVSFPDDIVTQEALLAKLMEAYRKKNDYSQIRRFVGLIGDGKYQVTPKYADSLKSVLTKLQIDSVQKSLDSGDKATAFNGYLQIYNNNDSTENARSNAAYNLAVLSYERSDVGGVVDWSEKALALMRIEDAVKFADSFLTMNTWLFLNQEFSSSQVSYQRIYGKLCKSNSSQKNLIAKNTSFIMLADQRLDEVVEFFHSFENCAIHEGTISEVGLELLRELSRNKRWDAFSNIYKKLKNQPKNQPQLIALIEPYRVASLNAGEDEIANVLLKEQESYYVDSKSKRLEIPVESLDIIAMRKLGTVQSQLEQMRSIPLKFPENIFNQSVKAKLQILDKAVGGSAEIQKIGSGKGIVKSSLLVIEAYEEFGNQLKNFIPDGKSPEYLQSFNKAMETVYLPILSNAQKQRSDLQRIIRENKIMSFDNASVFFGGLKNEKKFFPINGFILMERGGQK